MKMDNTAQSEKYLLADKIFRVLLLTVWGILFFFGICTLLQPKWLTDLSKPGRKEEAQSYIEVGNSLLYHANQNNSMEQYREALSNYRQAIRIDSTNIEAMENSGIACLYLNMLDEARNIFYECLMIDTITDYHTYTYLGDLFERRGDVEKAMEFYLISVKNHPNPSYQYRKAGLFCLQLERFDDAQEYLKHSIELETSFENFYKAQLIEAKDKAMKSNDLLNLRMINFKLQKTDFSADLKRYDRLIFKQAHKRSKDLGFAYMYLGTACYCKSEFAEAVSNYRICLRYYPELYSKVSSNLDLALEKAGME